MADRTFDVIYNQTGQIVETYIPEAMEGITSSATCSVFGGTVSLDDTAEFSPTVTVDTVSTTVDVASGYTSTNRRRMYVAATTNIAVGRVYLAENILGQREMVKVAAIASADYVDLEDELKYSYGTSSASLKGGIRMTFPVDNTWAATESKILLPSAQPLLRDSAAVGVQPSYKAVWSYTVNSLVRRHYTYLRLVRQKSQHGVTIHDLKKRWPDLSDQEFREVRGQQFAYAIDKAWGSFRADVISAGYRPEQIRDTELVDELVLLKSLHIIAQMGIAPGRRDITDFIAESAKEYRDLLTGTITAVLRIAVDESTEGNASLAPVPQIFFER